MSQVKVFRGPPPLEWLWDCFPLAAEAWGNILGFNDGSGDGHTIEMRLWLQPHAPMSNFPPPCYRPAHAPLPPGFANGGTRSCYIPTDADKALVSQLFSGITDITDRGNPPWPQVEARLIAAGYDKGKLATFNAPTLLLLLQKVMAPQRAKPPRAGGVTRQRRQNANAARKAKSGSSPQKISVTGRATARVEAATDDPRADGEWNAIAFTKSEVARVVGCKTAKLKDELGANIWFPPHTRQKAYVCYTNIVAAWAKALKALEATKKPPQATGPAGPLRPT